MHDPQRNVKVNILLAIDNSEHSRVPVEVLLMRPWPKGCEIKVLSVVENAQAANEAEKLVADVCARIKSALPDATTSSVVVTGDSKDVIIEKAQSWPADLVVMGARGRRGLTRILLGSVSQTVLLYGPCSTLIARNPGDDKTLKRVLVAVDNSDHSRKALEWTLSLPWAEQTEIKVIAVLKPLVDEYTDGFSALYTSNIVVERAKAVDATETFLQQSATSLKTALPKNKISTEAAEGDPGEQVLKLATDWGAQLIIMGSRGHGGLSKMWLGSVSQEVVLQAPCPVEVIRSRVD